MKLSASIILLCLATQVCCRREHSPNPAPWIDMKVSITQQLLDIEFASKDTGFVIGLVRDQAFKNVLFSSYDGGKTWADHIFPTPEDGGVVTLSVYNSGLLFAAKNGAFKSLDRGQTWLPYSAW